MTNDIKYISISLSATLIPPFMKFVKSLPTAVISLTVSYWFAGIVYMFLIENISQMYIFQISSLGL